MKDIFLRAFLKGSKNFPFRPPLPSTLCSPPSNLEKTSPDFAPVRRLTSDVRPPSWGQSYTYFYTLGQIKGRESCNNHLGSIQIWVINTLSLAGIWTQDLPSTKLMRYQLSYPGLDYNPNIFNILDEHRSALGRTGQTVSQSGLGGLVGLWTANSSSCP